LSEAKQSKTTTNSSFDTLVKSDYSCSTRPYSDTADRNAWYFCYVIEATNSHWFKRIGSEEIWTEVITYD